MTILWKTLASYSRRHELSYQELKEDSDEYFQKGLRARRAHYIGSNEEMMAIIKFLEDIMTEIEVVTPNTSENTIVYFPR